MMIFRSPLSRPVRKKTIVLFSFLFSLLLAGSSIAKVVDRVVAGVNDDVILLSDVEDTGKAFFDKIRAEAPEQSREEALKKARNEVIESLIEKSLIIQKAKKDNVSVSDEEVKRAYEQMQKRSGLSEDKFLEKVKEAGLTKDKYLSNLRQQVLQDKLINTDVRSKIVITDAMVKQYYDDHHGMVQIKATKGGYALLQIGFAWGEVEGAPKSVPVYADEASAAKTAERVLGLAKEGQDFSELAKKYSNMPSAADGGDIGVFQDDEIAGDMREAIIHLKPGEISSIIRTPAGYQFFKLLASKEGVDTQTSYESAKEAIRQTLYEQELRKTFEVWVKNLKDEAYIQKL